MRFSDVTVFGRRESLSCNDPASPLRQSARIVGVVKRSGPVAGATWLERVAPGSPSRSGPHVPI